MKEIPEFYSQLDDQFIAEHGLSDLMDVVNSVPSLRTDYVPRDSIVREFVGAAALSIKSAKSDNELQFLILIIRNVIEIWRFCAKRGGRANAF